MKPRPIETAVEGERASARFPLYLKDFDYD